MNWTFTAAEKKAINAAYDRVEYLLDGTTSNGAYRLRDALKIERRQRKDATVAKALLVRGFVDGLKKNPRADVLSMWSDGIATAAMLGARSRGDRGRKVANECSSALAAFETYQKRNIEKVVSAHD